MQCPSLLPTPLRSVCLFSSSSSSYLVRPLCLAYLCRCSSYAIKSVPLGREEEKRVDRRWLAGRVYLPA